MVAVHPSAVESKLKYWRVKQTSIALAANLCRVLALHNCAVLTANCPVVGIISHNNNSKTLIKLGRLNQLPSLGANN